MIKVRSGKNLSLPKLQYKLTRENNKKAEAEAKKEKKCEKNLLFSHKKERKCAKSKKTPQEKPAIASIKKTRGWDNVS